MKTKIFMFIAVFAMVVTTVKSVRVQGEPNDLLLENIEALGREHGEIDEELAPYKILSEQKVYIGDMPYPTIIPCCKSINNKYSGCAKGLDDCK